MGYCLVKYESKVIRSPRISFLSLKNAILPANYDLSVMLVNEHTSRTLNKKWRGKDAAATILSFPLSTHSGEIVMEPRSITEQSKEFESSRHDFFTFLFIHGLLHLAGYTHGSTMKKAERKWCRHFNIAYPSHV